MGRSVTALGDDLDAYYYNPAGYAYQKVPKLNTMYAKQMDQFNVYYTGYGQRVLSGYGAVNLYMLRLDDIPQTSYSNGSFTSAGSSFEYSSKAVFLSYAAQLKSLLGSRWGSFGERSSIGINIKYLNEILFNNQASGMGIDIGGIYRMNNDVRFGVMAVNLLQPVMTWDTDSAHKDIVSRKFQVGVAYTGFKKFILSADVSFEPHEMLSNYGVEYRLNDYFSLRGGSMAKGYTFGLGLHYEQVNFDYVFVKDLETVIDDTHKFSIGYIFGSGADEVPVEETSISPERPVAPPIEQSKPEVVPPSPTVTGSSVIEPAVVTESAIIERSVTENVLPENTAPVTSSVVTP